jgi:hypothetical protein
MAMMHADDFTGVYGLHQARMAALGMGDSDNVDRLFRID